MHKLSVAFLVLFMGIGCSKASPLSPSPVGSATPVDTTLALPAGNLQELGGLDLDGYCRSLGNNGATLVRDQVGPNAAFNNWRCRSDDGTLHHFSMTQACKWQYGINAVQTHPRDKNDAFTWICYTNLN